ncbi:hypothetical protein EV363DRAFT_1180372, partial [Boletus edulis]
MSSRFFHLCITTFVETILCYDLNAGRSSTQHVGVFGDVSGFYGCVEAQGRGSLHCHMLIWLTGALNCDEIKKSILDINDSSLCSQLPAHLDNVIWSSIPCDPLPEIEIPSSIHHPCAVRGPSLEGDMNTVRDMCRKDVHHLAKACQVHKHTATCFKYWKGPPEPKECRFGLDAANVVGRTYIDEITGDVHVRQLDGMVNCFNDTILQCLRCNMDIQFVGSGSSAKAILYYITDYITKTQLKAHVAYSSLEVAASRLGEFDPTVDDVKQRAKRLLQKCAFCMISHQELSAQQVSSYLLDHGDHYSSHSYRCLYWRAFENLIDKELPSPEC